MGQWIILYLFVCLLTGVIAASSIIRTVLDSKEKLLQAFLLFFLAFTLMVVVALFYSYLITNIERPSVTAIHFLYIFSQIVNGLFLYALIRYINIEKDLDQHRWLHGIIIGMTVLMMIVGFLSGRPDVSSPRLISLVQPWATIYIGMFALFMVYVFLPINGKESTIPGQFKKFVKRIEILSYIFMPFIFVDIIFNDRLPIRFFPLLYSIFAIFLAVFVTNNRRHIYKESSHLEPGDAFYEDYKISKREREVLELILRGHTNPRIGQTLFISMPTVKTHIQRIFQKTGVTSRFELIRFLSSEK